MLREWLDMNSNVSWEVLINVLDNLDGFTAAGKEVAPLLFCAYCDLYQTQPYCIKGVTYKGKNVMESKIVSTK